MDLESEKQRQRIHSSCREEEHFVRGYIGEKSEVFKEFASVLVIEKNGTPVRLMLRNIVVTGSTNEEADKLYPEGAEVIVKRKLPKHDDDYVHTFAIDAGYVKVVSFFPKVKSIDPDELRDLGNTQFTLSRYEAADELYTRSVGVAKTNMQRLLGHSNRAEANLKLGRNEKAWKAACAALEIDSKHEKSLFRKGRALLGICQYKEASKCFQQAIAGNKNSEVLKKAYDSSRILSCQSELGDHDLSVCILGGSYEFADFIGPVEIKMSRNEHGRGLFVTKDVKLGELLLVWNAAAGPNSEMDIMTKILSACRNSPRILQQVYSMASSSKNLNSREVPSMDIFRPNSGLGWLEHVDVNSDEIDTDRIQEMWQHNAENTVTNFTVVTGRNLFTLTSFINHSCLANVTALHVGPKILFIFAGKEIKAGEEMLRSYSEVLETSPCIMKYKRNELLPKLQCERCEMEQQLEQAYPRLVNTRKRLLSIQERANSLLGPRVTEGVVFMTNSEAASPAQIALDHDYISVAEEAEKVLCSMKNVSDEHKWWIRVAYVNAYATYYVTGRNQETIGMPSCVSFMEALHRLAPGDNRTQIQLQALASVCKESLLGRCKEIIMDECRSTYGWKIVNRHPQLVRNLIMNAVTGKGLL